MEGAFPWSWRQEGMPVQPYLAVFLCLAGTSPFPPQSAAAPGTGNLGGQSLSALRKVHGGEADNAHGFLSVKIKLNFVVQKVMIFSGGLVSVRLMVGLVNLIFFFQT